MEAFQQVIGLLISIVILTNLSLRINDEYFSQGNSDSSICYSILGLRPKRSIYRFSITKACIEDVVLGREETLYLTQTGDFENL